jgi:MoaA/NifB/PqqE/SkfB family radical SAM enzyme/SAM-dependent methyltransferase
LNADERLCAVRGDEFFTKVAGQPPFSRLHPKLAAFFKDYLAGEKVIRFGDRFVLNTHFPPYPSPAFDRLVGQFSAVGEATPDRRLFSVTWAVTNRCNFRCWHCYNAGRCQDDVPLEAAVALAEQVQEMGAVKVNLTGGEPLLREDLEEIAGAFDARTMLVLGTAADGLTPRRARSLADRGVFAVGISLDSASRKEHDRLRGRAGAFRLALDGLRTARDAGLYPYVVSVATREFLARQRFTEFLRFARDAGALEVHLLEPSATGRLAGRNDVLLSEADRRLILAYQREVAEREDLPVLSSFTYLESDAAFGCGAGLTHLYIDGSGEVCPCNLVPLSFGNVLREPLKAILDRMGGHFRRPRCGCVGHLLAAHVPASLLPAPPHVSEEVCARFLPREHDVPRFFKLRSETLARVGREELRDAYDQVHGDYDAFWLARAGQPVDELVARLNLAGGERVFEAGCGTGHATRQLTQKVGPSGSVLGVDLSEKMLEQARRLGQAPWVQLMAGDALEALRAGAGRFDVVLASWVLGYIPLEPFFAAAEAALAPGGRLAFVVHKKDSPRRELSIFAELVAEDPSSLLKQVDFDFPRDAEHVRSELACAGLTCEDLHEGTVTFECADPQAVLEHLLRSGAGTAFHDAVDPARRPQLERRFLERLAEATGGGPCRVVHEYVSCIARKP